MIRRVTESELPLCLRVIHEAFGTVAEEFGLTPDNCPTNGAFMPLTRLLEDYQKGDAMFVCREGGAIAGFMQLSRRGQAVYELEKLAVLPEYRHRGYGKALLGFAKQEAAANGAARIHIGIIEENERLKRWYLANGFGHMGPRVFSHLPFTVGFLETACGG